MLPCPLLTVHAPSRSHWILTGAGTLGPTHASHPQSLPLLTGAHVEATHCADQSCALFCLQPCSGFPTVSGSELYMQSNALHTQPCKQAQPSITAGPSSCTAFLPASCLPKMHCPFNNALGLLLLHSLLSRQPFQHQGSWHNVHPIQVDSAAHRQ